MPDFVYPVVLFATSVAGIAAIGNQIAQRAKTRDAARITYGVTLAAGALFWFGVWTQGGLLADVLNDDSPYATCEIPNAPSETPATTPFGVRDRIVVRQGLTGGAVSVERTRHGVTIRRDEQTITTDSRTGTASGGGSFASCSPAEQDQQ